MSPGVLQRLQRGQRSDRCVCVSSWPHLGNAFQKKKKICSNLWCLHSGTYRNGYVPTPSLLPLPRTHFMGSSSMEHTRGEAAAEQRQQKCPRNSTCCLFSSIPRGAQQQMAGRKHKERQLKEHWRGAGMEWLGLLNLGGRGLKGGLD